MALASAANGLCTNNCPILADTITVQEGPNCSTGAAVFKAKIAAATGTQTREIFCALEEWQKHGGVIMIDDAFHSVDPNVTIRRNPLTNQEGGDIPIDPIVAFLTVPVFAAMVLLVILIVKHFRNRNATSSKDVSVSSLSQWYEA